MLNNIKAVPLRKKYNDDKSKSGPIVQPRARKPCLSVSHSSIIFSPTKKSTNPGIIRPTNKSQPILNMSQENNCSSYSIKTSLSVPNMQPLDSLDPLKQKKINSRARHRKSCCADISWSPDLVNQENDVIRKKTSVRFDDSIKTVENKLHLEPINCAPPDDKISPLCNYVEI